MEFLRSAHLQLTSYGKDYLNYPTFQSVHLFIQVAIPISVLGGPKSQATLRMPRRVHSIIYTKWPFYDAQVAPLYYRSRGRQDFTISWVTALILQHGIVKPCKLGRITKYFCFTYCRWYLATKVQPLLLGKGPLVALFLRTGTHCKTNVLPNRGIGHHSRLLQ